MQQAFIKKAMILTAGLCLTLAGDAYAIDYTAIPNKTEKSPQSSSPAPDQKTQDQSIPEPPKCNETELRHLNEFEHVLMTYYAQQNKITEGITVNHPFPQADYKRAREITNNMEDFLRRFEKFQKSEEYKMAENLYEKCDLKMPVNPALKSMTYFYPEDLKDIY